MRVVYYVDRNLEGQIGIVRIGETVDEASLRLDCREVIHVKEFSGNIIDAIENLMAIDFNYNAENDFISFLKIITRLPLSNSKVWEIFTNYSEVEQLFRETGQVFVPASNQHHQN